MGKNGLGKRINIARKARGLTADRLSEMCSINATYLRQIEGGAKMPSLPVFIDMCRALRIRRIIFCKMSLREMKSVRFGKSKNFGKAFLQRNKRLFLTMIKAVLEYQDE